MKPERQRVAIAEACGWTEIYGELGLPPNPKPEYVPGFRIPDYLSDLNAMHEAEKVLFPKFTHKYKLFLADLRGFGGNNHDKIWHATAARRAEAFLRTLGKWEED